MKFFELRMRLIAPLVVMCCLLGVCGQVAQAQAYTNDPNIADFTASISNYATFSNYSSNTGCTVSPFTPTAVELLTTSCRVFGGTLAGLPATFAGQNWILASFSEPVSTIVVFPNIDHFGSPYDGYQYQIYGSNDGLNWTPLFDATSVSNTGEPFTLVSHTGTAPTSVNNVLTPQTPVGGGLPSTCSAPNPPPCEVGYIATFNFPTAYQFYAFGASTVAFNLANTDQEFSAVGTTVATAARVGIFPPTSGALLTINGTVGATVVNRAIYDSQIHTGNVRQVPVGSGESNCNANDQTFPTDAYVLQGSSWTGCDAGDTFEFQASGHATVSGAGYSFDITTSYTGPQCNHNSMVCVGAGASTGFLTIKNTSGVGNDFSVGAGQTGITLSGTPVSLTAANAAFCPPAGGGSDTIAALANGASAVLALSTDSSDCGGLNAPQTQTLVNGVTDVFPIGNDDYQITPFDSDQLIGATIYHDTVTILPRPVPAGPLVAGKYGSETPSFATSAFSGGTNFPGQNCIAYDDLSALGNPVCLEFQVSCTPPAVTGAINNCLGYLDTAQIDFTKDHNSLTTIGGVAFLGQHDGTPAGYNGNCPTSGFYLNNFLQYTPTNPDPITTSGRGNSCYVGTFDPNAAPVPVGQVEKEQTFVGFLSSCSVSNNMLNIIQAGQAVVLCWQTFSDAAGTVPVTNLTLCTDPTGATCSTNPPSVFIGTVMINCADTGDVLSTVDTTVASGGSGLQFITPPLPATPFYQYNLKTVKGSTGCFTPILEFSNGFVTPPGVANFQFKH